MVKNGSQTSGPACKYMYLYRKWITIHMQTQFAVLTPFENFLFALKEKETKRQIFSQTR